MTPFCSCCVWARGGVEDAFDFLCVRKTNLARGVACVTRSPVHHPSTLGGWIVVSEEPFVSVVCQREEQDAARARLPIRDRVVAASARVRSGDATSACVVVATVQSRLPDTVTLGRVTRARLHTPDEQGSASRLE